VRGGKDYSATPLGKKLGAKPGVDVLVFFTTTRAELERRFPALKMTLAPADGLWVAWPKKASRIETDLDFPFVQQLGLAVQEVLYLQAQQQRCIHLTCSGVFMSWSQRDQYARICSSLSK